jgi:hypothetical protein
VGMAATRLADVPGPGDRARGSSLLVSARAKCEPRACLELGFSIASLACVSSIRANSQARECGRKQSGKLAGRLSMLRTGSPPVRARTRSSTKQHMAGQLSRKRNPAHRTRAFAILGASAG